MATRNSTSDVLTLANAVAATGGKPSAYWVDQFGHVQSFVNWSIQVAGTFVGTVTVEGSLDNSTWVALVTTPTPITGPGLFAATKAANVAVPYVRANVTAYTSGAITVLAVGVS